MINRNLYNLSFSKKNISSLKIYNNRSALLRNDIRCKASTILKGKRFVCSTKEDSSFPKSKFSHFLSQLKKHHHKIGKVDRTLPNIDFLEWLIGFTEGDGCFSINKKGDLSFIITQSIDNLFLLKAIREQLGIGTILQQGKRVYRFVLQKREEISLIVELFNGNIVLPSRKEQFEKFFKRWKEKIEKKDLYKDRSVIDNAFLHKDYKKRQNMPSLKDLWLLGFVEAEGCFTVSFLSNSTAFRTRFVVSQKGDRNLPVLSSLLVLFGGGTIEGHSVKDNYSYIASGLKNTTKVYDYFDKNINNFQGIKRESYTKWKDVNEMIKNKEHLDRKKRIVLIEKAKEINAISRKSK